MQKADPKWFEEGSEVSLDFDKLKKVVFSRESVLSVAV